MLARAILAALLLPLLLVGADSPALHSIRIETSLKTWLKLKENCGGNYSYTHHWSSFTGHGHRTTIIVLNNKVTERSFESFSGHPPLSPSPGKPTAPPKGNAWTETGKAIGTHEQGHPPKTLDQLYEEAAAILGKPRPTFKRLSLRFDKRGLLLACYVRDLRIADDAPTHGVNITKIEIGQRPQKPNP